MPPSRQVIFNADDFGLHPDINRGILATVHAGIVRSLSVVTNSPYFEESADALRAYPDVSVGIHLNLTDGEPLSDKENLSFLLDKEGTFPRSHWAAALRIFRHPGKRQAIFIEYDRQILKLKESGLMVRHLDSHGHLHTLFPDIVAELAKSHGIPYVRVPSESLSSWITSAKIPLVHYLSRSLKRRLRQNRIRYTDHFIGIQNAGHWDNGKIRRALQGLRPGLTEFAVHPAAETETLHDTYAWDYAWQEETDALCDPELLQTLHQGALELTHFH